jgi:hypothetical protein
MVPVCRFIPLEEFNPEWVKYLFRKFESVVVPTEVVVYELGQKIEPKMARLYWTDLYLLDGVPATYKQIVEHCKLHEKKFKGSGHYDQLLLVEVWSDYGSDGHVEYELRGYRFVPQSIVSKQRNQENKFVLRGRRKDRNAMVIPDCMADEDDRWAFQEEETDD